jgi:hypothetical protein
MAAPARAKKLPVETLSREERIRRRAYELYIQRGNQSGSELDDWLQAVCGELPTWAECRGFLRY